mgnify:CR=1 FL=1
MRKISEYYKLNENLKINGDNILGGNDKTYKIEEALEELNSLKNLMSVYLDNDNNEIKSVMEKIDTTSKRLQQASSNQWKYVKLYKGEWIPLMDDQK